jgi:long-chain acyl-CoA synthetase
LKPYEKGEICIKGNAVMNGYLNKPDATEETICDGWLRTGDVGYVDEDDFFYVVDRKKDMINRGGENIYPREIEVVLESHPDITAVAVLGHPDEALGERVKAIIETAQPDVLTDIDIATFLKDKIAKYKIPEIIEFTTQIPRNPTGKILKRNLRES